MHKVIPRFTLAHSGSGIRRIINTNSNERTEMLSFPSVSHLLESNRHILRFQVFSKFEVTRKEGSKTMIQNDDCFSRTMTTTTDNIAIVFIIAANVVALLVVEKDHLLASWGNRSSNQSKTFSLSFSSL